MASTGPFEMLPPGTQMPHSEVAQATWTKHTGAVQLTGPAEVLEDASISHRLGTEKAFRVTPVPATL